MLRTVSSHTVHLLMDAVVGIVGLVGLAGCVLAWRLAQGPIDITSLVQREATRLVQPGGTLNIGSAALTWEGFHAADSPLDIRWRDVAITTGAGAPISLPRGSVTLSVSRLLLGQVVPRSVEVDDATIDVQRNAAGTVRLDLEKQPPQAASAPPAVSSEGSVETLMRELLRPAAQRGGVLPFLAQLNRVHIRNATVTVRDPGGLLLQANSATVELQREPSGGISGQAGVALDVRGTKSTVAMTAEVTSQGTQLEATATPVSPAAIAASLPGMRATLSPLAGFDAPVGLKLDALLGPHLVVKTLQAELQVGAGAVQAGKGLLQIKQASAELVGAADHIAVQSFRLALQPAPGAHATPPVVTGQANATRANGRMHAGFSIDIDHAAFADLASYWPAGTGGGARPWIIQNIPTGLAENAHVAGTLDGADDFSTVAITALSGGLSARDLTVFWLRPVPPLDHGQAKLTIDGPDALHIDVASAMQGKLNIANGRVGITGLSQKDQFGDISLNVAGGLPDILTLLNNKRLNLLSRRPIPMQNPAGTAQVKLNVKLPLDARVTLDDIGINASAKLANVHLGGIAAGRDLDQGQLTLTVDPNELKVAGNANVGDIPVALTVDMDFRNGPPSQVLTHVTAVGTATATQLENAGLWGGVVTGGTAGLNVDYSAQRNGQGAVGMQADLAAAVLTTPLGWDKPAGPPASLSARVTLLHDSLTGIDRLKASGPGLLIASHTDMIAGKPRILRLDAVKIGRTDTHGSITFPAAATDRLAIVLRGQTLDLSSYFEKRDSGNESDDDTTPGRPWSVDLVFDRAILAKDETLAPVSVRADNNGTHITHGELTAGPRGQVRGTIVPVPGGRKLTVNATDSGAVLLASGVANNIRGGTLHLDASYADTKPHEPLSGTATMSQFRITNAPIIGRLLTAMTLYGAVNLLSGPGLGFQQANVPFRWQQRVLHLDNARAFSASLGLTAQGDIDLRNRQANLKGTVVPAYFFNQLPGKIPLLGRLFSPEKGGGLFAANYSVSGKLANPKVSVNPLSALTPGFLRGVFKLF